MNREIVYVIVFMVFAYIIGKYKLLPYIAAKKILKESKNGSKEDGSASATVHVPMGAYPAMMGGLPVNPIQPQPEKPDRRDMYFEYRLIGTDFEAVKEVASAIDSAVNDILISLRNRGICPDSLDIVSIDGCLLLAYVTYTL